MTWDVIVIGSGIGGLSCAGRLAAAGRTVLVLEQSDRPGGYLTSFRRGDLVFDSAVDCFGGLDEHGLLTWLLRLLDVDRQVPRVRLDPIRWSRFPGMSVPVDADLPAYIERLLGMFPEEREGIDRLFRAAGRIHDEVEHLLSGVRDEGIVPPLPSALAPYWNATFSRFLADHVRDRRLAGVLSDRCPFLGLSPGRVSAIRMIAMMMSYFRSGAWRPVGGHQRIVDAIAEGIRRKGGAVKTRSKVSRLLVDRGTVTHAITDRGEEYRSRHVVSAMDWTETFHRLLALREPSKPEAGATGPSSSFFILYGAMRGELPLPDPFSSIGSYDTFDLERFLTPYRPFRDTEPLGITIPTVEDPSLAPPGHHVVLVHELVPQAHREDWGKTKARRIEELVGRTERVLPGWSSQIVHLESATPLTLERYTGNLGGAAFGWEQVPVISRTRHGLGNLHLAGHWTEFGGGVMAAAVSGLRAASAILRADR